MPDFSRNPVVTLVFGASGYGKTTFCYRNLVNAATPQPANPEPAACIFIFDWKLEAQSRLGIPAVTTAAACEAALADRVVVFNPHVAFPGTAQVLNPEGEKVLNDEKMALRWFARWVYGVCQRGPGRKIFYVDELRNFGNKFSVMPEIARIIRMGRAEGLESLFSTQYPRDYHMDIRSGVTEWVAFNTIEEDNLAAVRPYFGDVAAMPFLNKGEFMAFNRESRSGLRGRVF